MQFSEGSFHLMIGPVLIWGAWS